MRPANGSPTPELREAAGSPVGSYHDASMWVQRAVLATVGVVLAVLLITLLSSLYLRSYTERTQTLLLGAVLLVTINLVVAAAMSNKSLTAYDALARREELRATLKETNDQLGQLGKKLDELTEALRRSDGGRANRAD